MGARFVCEASRRIDDFLSENVGIEEIVRFFEAFVSEPKDVEAGFVAIVTQLKIQLSLRSPGFDREEVNYRLYSFAWHCKG